MIGCGKLGLPTAELMAEFYDVVGYDIRPISSAKIILKPSISETIQDRDFIFIAVPTPHEIEYGGEIPTSNLPPKDFNYEQVVRILEEISKHATNSQLIVLISTVLPGTTRRILRGALSQGRFIYNPFVAAMGSITNDLKNPECLIIGTEDGKTNQDTRLLLDFYEPICGNKMTVNIGTWDEAEAIKIFYNTYISAKIVIVNMIQDVAEKIGNINVDIVTDALKSATHRITSAKYLTAGLGDAGPCHPRDNIALSFLSHELGLHYDLFHAITHAREQQAKGLADRLIFLARKHKLPIVIHGKAYKPRVPYTYGSYSLLIGYYIEQSEIPLHYVDPLTGDFLNEPLKAVYLLAHNYGVTYPEQCNSRKNSDFYCEIPYGSVILDPWRTGITVDGCEIIDYGKTRIDSQSVL